MQEVIVVIVSHQIREGQMDEAIARIDSNGSRMETATGFISRLILRPTDGNNVITTVTQWSKLKDYSSWQEENRKSNVHAGKESPYEGNPSTQVFLRVGSRLASDS